MLEGEDDPGWDGLDLDDIQNNFGNDRARLPPLMGSSEIKWFSPPSSRTRSRSTARTIPVEEGDMPRGIYRDYVQNMLGYVYDAAIVAASYTKYGKHLPALITAKTVGDKLMDYMTGKTLYGNAQALYDKLVGIYKNVRSSMGSRKALSKLQSNTVARARAQRWTSTGKFARRYHKWWRNKAFNKYRWKYF